MVLDRYVLSLDVAGFAEALAKFGTQARRGSRRAGADKTNHGHPWLLRPRRRRPCGSRAEKADEPSPPQVEHQAAPALASPLASLPHRQPAQSARKVLGWT